MSATPARKIVSQHEYERLFNDYVLHSAHYERLGDIINDLEVALESWEKRVCETSRIGESDNKRGAIPLTPPQEDKP